MNFGCGNDGGISFVPPGAIGFEMVLLEKQGFNPAHVLKMATLNNAKILGVEKDIGIIENGKLADLAIFSKNPIETLENIQNPKMVFKNGQLVYNSNL